VRSRVFSLVSAGQVDPGLGVAWTRATLAMLRPEKKEKKEKKEKQENSKIVSRGPGRPRGESRIFLVIGTPKSKRITLGDPGYPEGIPRVDGIPT